MPTPSEILSQCHRDPSWSGWVPTISGKGYRPFDDHPGPLNLTDLSYGLAHTYRYGGQTTPSVTCAEHVCLVAAIIRALWPGNPDLERGGLLHDASEAILHDIQAPLRKNVLVVLPSGEMRSWEANDTHVTRNIAKFYGVLPDHLEAPEVRAADVLATVFEKRDCPSLRNTGDWGLPVLPAEVASLKIWGMSPGQAQGRFLSLAAELGLEDV